MFVLQVLIVLISKMRAGLREFPLHLMVVVLRNGAVVPSPLMLRSCKIIVAMTDLRIRVVQARRRMMEDIGPCLQGLARLHGISAFAPRHHQLVNSGKIRHPPAKGTGVHTLTRSGRLSQVMPSTLAMTLLPES
jgi:hypothetical protein